MGHLENNQNIHLNKNRTFNIDILIYFRNIMKRKETSREWGRSLRYL